MIIDSAFADKLLKLQAAVDRLEAELDAMYLQKATIEDLHAKTKEYTEAYKALNDLALSAVTVS
ncbi:hypothetical protein [Aeromonas veronii]|uniref:hypothetical protein n=1 Tax=Aeromonas veronii TaxID=654 RepID=UPI0032EFD384